MTFGERIRTLRKEKHLSQNALAKMASVSPRTIFGYEAGTTYPRTKEILHRLAEALGVESDVLMDCLSPADYTFSIRRTPSLNEYVHLLTQEVKSLILGEHISDEEKELMVYAIMNAYWESRKMNRGKNDTTI